MWLSWAHQEGKLLKTHVEISYPLIAGVWIEYAGTG